MGCLLAVAIPKAYSMKTLLSYITLQGNISHVEILA